MPSIVLLLALGFSPAADAALARVARPAVVRSAARPAAIRTSAELRGQLARHVGALRELSVGAEHLLATDGPRTAERMYVLEVKAIKLLLSASDLPLREPGRAELLEETRALIGRVLHQKDHVLGPHALRTVRAAVPGEPMARRKTEDSRDVYELLDRNDSISRRTQANNRDKSALYRARWQEFVAAGGSAKDIVPLSSGFLADVPSGAMVTWAHRTGDDKIWVSTKARHVVAAEGRDAYGAGELKVWKDKRGEIQLVLLSNSSGSVKASASSLEAPAQLLSQLGVPASRVMLTSQSPADPQLVKLLLISDRSLSESEIAHRMRATRALPDQPDEMPR